MKRREGFRTGFSGSGRAAALLAISLPFLAGGARAATLHVRTDASGRATGTSRVDAFTDLQEALATAQPGEAVRAVRAMPRPC